MARTAAAGREARVVGSGPNGLAAAITLARAGWRVRVHEEQPAAGGGARSAELSLPGCVHDLCSAVHPLAAGSPFFRELLLERHGLAWVHPGAPCAHPLDGGDAAACERSLEATADGLGADGEAYARLVGPLARGFDRLARDVLAPPLHVPRHPLLLARFAWASRRSAYALARARFRGERARALIAGMACHAVLPLEVLPSGAFALVLCAAAHAVGWPMPRGGAQRISDALCAHLASLGGEVETGRRVRSLDELPPDAAVLLDTSPREAAALAGARFPPAYRRRLERFPHGPGAFRIDWVLDGPIPWAAAACRRAGTVHVGGTLEEIAEAERAVARGRHAERPFVLLSQPSLFDPTRAPEGRHVIWAYCHVPNGSSEDQTARVEAQVERFAPGFRRRIVARAARTAAELPATNRNLVGGDFGGGRQDVRGLLVRPRAVAPYATPDPLVFLASASTPPGGGVHGMCGHHAALAALAALARHG